MEVLSGKVVAEKRKGELAQRAAELRGQGAEPKLVILRDNDDPVIEKYVGLKRKFGAEIGVEVEDFLVREAQKSSKNNLGEAQNLEPKADQAIKTNYEKLREKILAANRDERVTGMILQLPLRDKTRTEELCELIAPEKDVDGLGTKSRFLTATARAIIELLEFYGFWPTEERIAVVGRGRLVGAPLFRYLQENGGKVEMFHRGSDLHELRNFKIVVSATGVPGVIRSADIAPGTVLVDAGTASEKGVIVGDVAEEVREREDLAAITPKIGGVGPLTVCSLFTNLLIG